MNTTSKIAWRNIWRNKRRSLLTLTAITLCTAILVFFMALQFSMYDTTTRATISTFQGALQVQAPGYLDKPEMRNSFALSAELLSRIRSHPGVTAAAPRAAAFALLSSEDRTYGAQIVGVDLQSEPRVSTIPSLVREGRYLTSQDGAEVVVGRALARNLRVSPGAEITVLGQGRDGSLAATVLVVAGIFESGVQELDRGLVEIPLTAFQDVFSMDSQIHSIAIATDRYGEIEQLRQELVAAFGQIDDSVTVLTWDELMPGIKQAIEFDMTFGWLFYFSLVLIVALLVLNTFLMSVLERTREFGLMLALGMKPLRISLLVITECLFLTAVGVCIGVLLGSGVILYFNVYGFYLPGSEEIMKVWNVPAVARPWLSLASLTLGPLVMMLSTAVTVLYPALRIFRLEAVEAMRAT